MYRFDTSSYTKGLIWCAVSDYADIFLIKIKEKGILVYKKGIFFANLEPSSGKLRPQEGELEFFLGNQRFDFNQNLRTLLPQDLSSRRNQAINILFLIISFLFFGSFQVLLLFALKEEEKSKFFTLLFTSIKFLPIIILFIISGGALIINIYL